MSYRAWISDLALEVGDLSTELAGTSRFFRERGVRFKLVFNKAGEDDDRWQITTTHGGVWAAQGKIVYGKRERVA